MKRPLTLVLLFVSLQCFSQQATNIGAAKWVDSVFNSLNEDQRIAQLMVVRMASLDGRRVIFYEKEVKEAISKYNIGGVCLFQGGPNKQATLINEMQAMSKTPLFISIDAENGLGMRMDSIIPLPRQMMMGAIDDPSLIYQYGRLVGEQCRRIGIQINYAPVVDVNNNPANPVINDRSFGEDKHKVAMLGIQYMRGLQDVGVMACAKHFPGHGDVSVDSHHDLPVITKTKAALDSLELYPFRQIVKAGIGSVMVAHLSIPALDNRKNIASSLSAASVTNLLRNDLGHKGLIITDALDMQGVAKYFPAGEISVKALEAGNDMLCLPGDIPGSIKKIKDAIKDKSLTWQQVNEHVKRVLAAKYQYGLSAVKPVNLNNLVHDLNAKTVEMHRQIAQRSITLLRNEDQAIFPLAKGRRVAYLGIGLNKDNEFAKQVREEYDAHVYYFDYSLKQEMIKPTLDVLKNRYDVVIIGVHKYNRFPANNFGISNAALSLIDSVQRQNRTITMVFGNPYAIKDLCDSRILVACYQDDEVTHQTAIDLLGGRFLAKGKLPVTVCSNFKSGAGIVFNRLLQRMRPADLGFSMNRFTKIDSIVNDAIKNHAIPGGVVLVAKDGKIAYEKSFGYMGYDSMEPVYPETIYDLASVTKIMATTLSVMKLYDEGKLKLNKTLGDYLSWTRGTNKERLRLWDVLLHQAGLRGWIPFYLETLDSLQGRKASDSIYAVAPDSIHMTRVAENLYMRRDWADTMYARILTSPVGMIGNYIYSDLDFIFLGKIVEQITGMTLDQYVQKTFYGPLHLSSTAFLPRNHFALNNIAPTEAEPIFRQQLLRGDVHDPGAAMFGGVSGHAGLFSDAYDIAVLCQMLLNGGKMNGIRFFKKETVDFFTSYHANSRRGLGFDKPERDNYIRPEPYPTLSASPQTFGHTGFTGTCVWIDPARNLIYIFLSNRVYNNGDVNRFLRMNVRPKVHELIYQSLQNATAPNYSTAMNDTQKM
ncbi:MAG: serine hydrolase [Chitinophagaceae bacterium]|nr:serine hydrolase [Chitinophagaceae bacterium]